MKIPPMRSEAEMMDLVLVFARQDERVPRSTTRIRTMMNRSEVICGVYASKAEGHVPRWCGY